MNFGDLRGILQYVPQFRGRTFVIALDGEVVASPNFSNILLDLAVLRSLNIRVVLVHGAAFQIRALAASRGVDLTNADGTGVTDERTLEVSLDAITRLSSFIMQSLTVTQIRAATANAIIAHPAGVLKGTDMGGTGSVDRVDTTVLRGFLDGEILPVIPPIGYDSSGRTLRVNSDTVAAEVGRALQAAKVIFLMAGEPDFGLVPQSARQLSEDVAGTLLKDVKESAEDGLVSKLRHAIRACQDGVPRVHLINGEREDALLAELFSNEGIGTMIFADNYQRIRAARTSDVSEMLLMMRRAVEEDKLISRTRDEIISRIGDFFVMEIDENVVGSVAVHFYRDGKPVMYPANFGGAAEDEPGELTAELACLYIKKNHENQGYGRKLVEFAENRAREAGAAMIFAISTQKAYYFSEKAGYRAESDLEVMPESRREAYQTARRKGSFLVKDLNPAEATARTEGD